MLFYFKYSKLPETTCQQTGLTLRLKIYDEQYSIKHNAFNIYI